MKAALAFPVITASFALAIGASPAAAQQAGPYTHEQCRAATAVLAETDGRDSDAADIVMSEDCEAYRRAFAFDVSQDMERMKALLKDKGIDYESALTERILECERRTHAVMLQPVAPGEPARNRDEILEACAANAQMSLYAAAIVELNAVERRRHEIEQRDYETAVEARDLRIRELEQMERDRQRAIEDARIAHENAMADWRRRVALCESGQIEYCQPQ
ncbi:hypothetical protein GCM10009127_17620 [Alteraurantiacibacter aestuarii]|uniref:DUF1311 domain-containing protein n=1 Tax=Alteraurantiacibacter aestuarii TaxID=650004 RepID=A0A844ZJK9_9SPHN|nr:hypothetical protein [Alteraurantiacibacter aestuarii]MXO87653.1 hypothetical protein [Alteraurantiacibacter aestuarii]